MVVCGWIWIHETPELALGQIFGVAVDSTPFWHLFIFAFSPSIPPLGFWLCHTSPPRERLPLVPDCHTMPPRERLPLGSWLCLKKTRAAFSLLSRVLLTREDWNYRKKKWKSKDTPRAQRDLVPKALSVLLGPFICSVNRSQSSKIALPF